MRAHFGLPSVVSEESEGKPPIQVKFEIPYFTTSGIQVRIFAELEYANCRQVLKKVGIVDERLGQSLKRIEKKGCSKTPQ